MILRIKIKSYSLVIATIENDDWYNLANFVQCLKYSERDSYGKKS